MRTRVRDVMTPDPVTIGASEPMLVAGRAHARARRARAAGRRRRGPRGRARRRARACRALPRRDRDRGLPAHAGHRRAARARARRRARRAATRRRRIAGDVLIGAAEPATLAARIKPGDTVIVGDRLRTPAAGARGRRACLISTGGLPPGRRRRRARPRAGAPRSSSRRTTPTPPRVCVSLAHAVGDLMDTDVLTVGPETLLSEAAEDLIASPQREAVVADDAGRVVGILTRTDIARGARRTRRARRPQREPRSRRAGIEDASVVEIVDHHRVGDIQTSGTDAVPQPAGGSTATIVATRYEQLGVEIPAPIAGDPALGGAHRHGAAQVADHDRHRPRVVDRARRASPGSSRSSSGWRSSARAGGRGVLGGGGRGDRREGVPRRRRRSCSSPSTRRSTSDSVMSHADALTREMESLLRARAATTRSC